MPISERAKQFMPFASLRGYGLELKKQEEKLCERRELSEEQLSELSKTAKDIGKGDIVKVTYYAGKGYIQMEGAVSGINLALRKLTVIKTTINFDDISELIITEKKA